MKTFILTALLAIGAAGVIALETFPAKTPSGDWTVKTPGSQNTPVPQPTQMPVNSPVPAITAVTMNTPVPMNTPVIIAGAAKAASLTAEATSLTAKAKALAKKRRAHIRALKRALTPQAVTETAKP